MADKPMLFSAPMIRALMEGRKTQTRRLIEPVEMRPTAKGGDKSANNVIMVKIPARFGGYIAGPAFDPPYAIGDRIYVRETFSGPHACDGTPPRDWPTDADVWHWADGDPDAGDWTRPKPGIHMPRWASRLTLVVTGVKVERLRWISPADAEAEGVEGDSLMGWRCYDARDDQTHWACPRESFRTLWDSLNAERAPWDRNPWVCAVTFTVHQSNIDRMEGSADA
jgi:hypothetical protein